MNNDAEASGPNTLPNAGLDLITFGFDARVEWDFECPLRELALSAASTASETQTARTHGRAGHHCFSLDITYDDALVGEVSIELHMAPSGGQLETSGRSSISLNPQRILRHVKRWKPSPAEIRFDGNDNSLPLDLQGRDALGPQLDAVEGIFAFVVRPFFDQLWRGKPCRFERPWIKGAEACFDRRERDAIATVQAAQRTLFTGARETHRFAYSRGARDSRGIPVAWWTDTQDGPTLKVYASAPVTVRHEVVCRSRGQVNELAGIQDAPFTPEGARALLLDFADAAQDLLRRLRDHTAAAAACGKMGELVLALGEVIDLARGVQRGRGRPCRPETVERCRRALDQLLSAGYCDLTGTDPKGGDVAAMNRLVDAGHATRHHSGQVYALIPRMAAAIHGGLPHG